MACRCVALISGSGSNLQAIIDRAQQQQWPLQWVGVLSNQPNAYGLHRAQQAGIATTVISRADCADRAAFDTALADWLNQAQPDLILLAGFMHILSAELVLRYQHCLLNIHPSLLPELRGLHTHQRALDAGLKQHGASVHFVTPDLDSGPIVIQASVPILAGDSADSLSQRVLAQEHRIYPLVVRWFVQGRLRWVQGQIYLDHQPLHTPLHYQPEQHDTL